MNPSGDSSQMARLIGIAVIIGLLAVALVAFAVSNNSSKPANQIASTPVIVSPATTAAASATAYRNRTYHATGAYRSPGGAQKVNVKLILSGDAVSDVTVTEGAIDGQSSEYQKMFISGIKAKVVGKKLDEVNVSRVSGSSLTSQGFNDAITQIKAQAKT